MPNPSMRSKWLRLLVRSVRLWASAVPPNEEIEVTNEHARSSEPSAFPAEACGNVGIDPEHGHAAQKISEVLPIASDRAS